MPKKVSIYVCILLSPDLFTGLDGLFFFIETGDTYFSTTVIYSLAVSQ